MIEFEEFFSEQYDPVVRSLTMVFDDRAAAEDAAQVGFERALRRWRTVSGLDRPGTWVYVVALRHGRRTLERDKWPEDDEIVDEDGFESDVISTMWIEEALRRLPARQRAAIVLRHLAGLRVKEIAEALGVTEGTIKASLHAAHRNLRVDLEDQPDHDEVVPDAP